MNTQGRRAPAMGCVRLAVVCQLLLAACAPGAPAPSGPNETSPSVQVTAASEPTHVISLEIQSGNSASEVTVVATTPTPAAEANPAVLENAEPVIFTGASVSIDQKCGHGDVIAPDGHALRATPRILPGNGNFLEKLPEGAQVDVIDCRLWTDEDGISWLAVRTAQNKLGWMFIQPDMFYVTIYPIVQAVPHAITGLPAGTTIAYVPPSECKSGPESTEGVATSIGIDLIPVVGDLKGVGEAATGCDMVTGASLGNWRWLGLLGLIGLSEIALLRHADEASDAARLADNLRMADNLDGSFSYSDEITMAALRNADSAADFRNVFSHADEAWEAGADSVRYFNNGAELSDEAVMALARLEQPCSFSANTLVVTAHGPLPIRSIEPGDQVLAWDEASGRQSFFPVTADPDHTDPVVVRLTIGGEVIETTPDHPFHVAGTWVAAGDLSVGDMISSASGMPGAVTRIETRTEPQTMYNLTVAQAHTYFVGNGQWLVHNACGVTLRRNMISAGLTPDWARNDAVTWQAHHIIPQQSEQHTFVQRATRGGWDINSAANGIGLPSTSADAARLGLPYHSGSHSTYSSLVRSELDSLEQRALREGWDDARCAQELQSVTLPQLREIILAQSGRVP